MAKDKPEKKLTDKEKVFCMEYIFDFNASRAARKAGYSEKSAKEIGYENLTKHHIKDEITRLQGNLEETSGITRLKVLREHEKLAFSSIAHLHDTWIERKEFDQLTDEQKSCIAEISTQTRTVHEYSAEKNKKVPVSVEFVKIKLYDKQKALDSIARMLGMDSATRIDHTTKGEPIQQPTINLQINDKDINLEDD